MPIPAHIYHGSSLYPGLSPHHAALGNAKSDQTTTDQGANAHTATDDTATGNTISTPRLATLMEEYLCDCDLRLNSPRTVETRRVFLKNLLWFLREKECTVCGVSELRRFFHYLMHGHEEAGGRFGNSLLKRAVRPITVMDYYTCFRSLFDWLVAQRHLGETPFAFIAKPQVREEVKVPLAPAQISALMEAARRSPAPEKYLAILALLLDTGCRASELVALKRSDLDLPNGRCRVLGKGDKYRTLFFGTQTADLLADYLALPTGFKPQRLQKEGVRSAAEQNPAQITVRRTSVGQMSVGARPAEETASPSPPLFFPSAPLFPSAHGGGALTRSGLLHLIKRLGDMAGVKDDVCIHALRRSFAVQMLRNGANVFTVQSLLGHTHLQQTRKYCAMALTDAEAQHRKFSPMDHLSSVI